MRRCRLDQIRPGGKSSGVRIGSLAQDHGALQRVVQLADVAGPGAAIRPRIVALSTPSTRLPRSRACFASKTADQLGDILAAVAQRRQVDRRRR